GVALARAGGPGAFEGRQSDLIVVSLALVQAKRRRPRPDRRHAGRAAPPLLADAELHDHRLDLRPAAPPGSGRRSDQARAGAAGSLALLQCQHRRGVRVSVWPVGVPQVGARGRPVARGRALHGRGRDMSEPGEPPQPGKIIRGAAGLAGSCDEGSLSVGPPSDVPRLHGLGFRLQPAGMELGHGADGAGRVVALVSRIYAEERILAHDPGWAAYVARVRSRLIPGLW